MSQMERKPFDYPGIDALKPKSPHECPRVAILDGANILMATTSRHPLPHKTASGLISLIRLLTAHGFDVHVNLQHKYLTLPSLGNEMLRLLVGEKVISVGARHMHDDLAMFELARMNGGVVISMDRFNDHQRNPNYKNLVETQSILLRSRSAPEHMRHSFTRDGHYIAKHIFEFTEHDKLYSYPTPGNWGHVLCTERRPLFTEERQKRLLGLCDKMLLKLREWEGYDSPDGPSQLPSEALNNVLRQEANRRNGDE